MLTLARENSFEEEIKKSRFIAHACHVDSVDDAMRYLEKIRDLQASHNCWAYKIGKLYRFSDDGEPGGTAGKPILGATEKQGLDHVMVVVTRYFGGIKLGAGGLVRAYSGVAAKCLQAAEKKEVYPLVVVRIYAKFDEIGVVYSVIDSRPEFSKVEKLSENYTSDGVELTLSLEESRLGFLKKAFQDASRGTIKIETVS
jgi:uncharacterized YigZ family protein